MPYKSGLAAMLEGILLASNMAANANDTTLIKNQTGVQYLP